MLLERLLDIEKTPLARSYSDEEYDLDGFRVWLDSLGRPQDELAFIHIAGTRGKGSTAAIAEGLLRALDVDTAMFTSPHLSHYGERFRYNGTPWTYGEFEAAMARLEARLGPEHRRSIEGPQPWRTVFEILTTLALTEFRERDLQQRASNPAHRQMVLWETGLGGRLDCTNVVTPIVSVITTISLDHTQILGETIEAITREKAGIIKPGRPVIVARQTEENRETVLRVIVERAAKVGAPVIRAWEHNPVIESAPVSTGLRVRIQLPGGEVADGVLPLHGTHQLGNLEAALAAVWYAAKEERRILDGGSISRGLGLIDWPGRLEVLADRAGALVLDGAHCPLGAKIVARTISGWETLATPPARGPWRLLWGMQSDKDHSGFLRAFVANLGDAHLASIHCYPVEGSRGASAELLATIAAESGFQTTAHESPAAAFRAASGPGSSIAIGTLYTLSSFRVLWGQRGGRPK